MPPLSDTERGAPLALVTGSSGAIGKAIARRFKAAGHRVCGIDLVAGDSGDVDCFLQADLHRFATDEGHGWEPGHSPSWSITRPTNMSASSIRWTLRKYPSPTRSMSSPPIC